MPSSELLALELQALVARWRAAAEDRFAVTRTHPEGELLAACADELDALLAPELAENDTPTVHYVHDDDRAGGHSAT